MLKLSITTLLAAIAVASHAISANYTEIKRLKSNIEKHHRAGSSIHKRYDINAESGLRACIDDHRALREQAKSDIEAAKNLPTVKYRFKMLTLTNAAFSCLYCNNNSSACDQMTEGLNDLNETLRNDGQ